MTDTSTDLLLRPVQRMLDAGVRYSTTAEALCAQLEGKSLQIQPGPTAWAVYFIAEKGRLRLLPGQIDTPDAVISGSVANLARLAAADPEQVIREGKVRISGNAEVAEEFRALLDMVRPDWEEELSRLIGDPLAHSAGRAVRELRGWARGVRSSLGRSLAEYLTEESRDVAGAYELQEFCADVDALARDVDRAEAQLKQLKQQHGAGLI